MELKVRPLNCTLLHHTPLWLAANGCRMSHDSHDKSDTKPAFPQPIGALVDGEFKSNEDIGYYRTVNPVCGPKDADLIKRIGIKMHHESILEFLTYIFDLELTTKDLLALSRHRVGISLTMQSTRYTTKKMLKSEPSFESASSLPRASKYIYITGRPEFDLPNLAQLEAARLAAVANLSNDDISLLLPQAWIYRGQIQFNARSLRHFFSLRAPGTHAHPGMQDLAQRLFDSLPSDHKYLFEDCFKDSHGT